MIAVAIAFPSGRFHATPWGRHVNEAALEWPPSPWRILRTFVATWKRKFDKDHRCAPPVIECLLRKLADPPLFVLPPASTSHVRHFMPWFKNGPADRTLVFDAFICIDKSHEIFCFWPKATLDQQERLALDLLVSHIGFLGRAESWVELRVPQDDEAELALKKVNCIVSFRQACTNGGDAAQEQK
jgi:CRISPR-associated protein Csb2